MKSKSEEDEHEHVVIAEKKPVIETLIPSEPIQNHNIEHVVDYPLHHLQPNHLLMEQPSTYNFPQYNHLVFPNDIKSENQFYCNRGFQFEYPCVPDECPDYLSFDDPVLPSNIDGDPSLYFP